MAKYKFSYNGRFNQLNFIYVLDRYVLYVFSFASGCSLSMIYQCVSVINVYYGITNMQVLKNETSKDESVKRHIALFFAILSFKQVCYFYNMLFYN